MKLSTRSEVADQFIDDLVAAARQHGGSKAKEAAEILAKWDRHGNNASDGAFLFLRFIQAAGNSFQNIGGYAVPPDPRQPLTTPKGFADPAKAAALLDREARRLEDEYDTMHVIWGARGNRKKSGKPHRVSELKNGVPVVHTVRSSRAGVLMWRRAIVVRVRVRLPAL